MHEGAGQDRWSHTSAILCVIANANRDPKKSKQFKPSDFDPYEIAKRKEKERHDADPESLAMLRETMQAWKGKK